MPSDQPAWALAYRRAVGGRIRAAREDAGLSQVRLGEIVGIDHKTVHRIEYGTSDPSLGLLAQIARALHVQMTDLLRE